MAIAGLPGGPAMLQELMKGMEDLGLNDRGIMEVLASVRDEGQLAC